MTAIAGGTAAGTEPAPASSGRACDMGGDHAAYAALAGLVVYCTPAALALASQDWQGDTGSLMPLILLTGIWSLLREFNLRRESARRGPLPLALALMLPVAALYVFAAAIGMTMLMALCAWGGGVLGFYALFGGAVLRGCWFPLLYLGLAVPLPYSVSTAFSASLREWLARTAVTIADRLSFDVAVAQNSIFIDQYRLAVESACAGSSSTFSLFAIILLFTYWYRGRDWRRTAIAVLLAAPIALSANVLRVLVLMLAVHAFGAGVLDTVIHPLAGLISFTLALGLFLLVDRAGRAALALVDRR